MSCSKCVSPNLSRLKSVSIYGGSSPKSQPSLWGPGSRGDYGSLLQRAVWDAFRDLWTQILSGFVDLQCCLQNILWEGYLWDSLTVTVLCFGTRMLYFLYVAAAAMHMVGNTILVLWKCYLNVALVFPDGTSWHSRLCAIPPFYKWAGLFG